jgi:SAM-dependent methyltransferase
VVGCGLGDDAEELARRGYAVTAFDVSPTAIARCRERFPQSRVSYRAADVLNLPGEWRGRFSLVVEINTIQSLPRADRSAAIAAIAATVAPGGLLFVRCRAPGEDEADSSERPWPVLHSELDRFTAAGLTQVDLIDHAPVPAAFPFLRVIYQRPSPR